MRHPEREKSALQPLDPAAGVALGEGVPAGSWVAVGDGVEVDSAVGEAERAGCPIAAAGAAGASCMTELESASLAESDSTAPPVASLASNADSESESSEIDAFDSPRI